jgi:hypothetical protein
MRSQTILTHPTAWPLFKRSSVAAFERSVTVTANGPEIKRLRSLQIDALTGKAWNQATLADWASEARNHRLQREVELYTSQTISNLERSHRCLVDTLRDVTVGLGLADSAAIRGVPVRYVGR